MKKLLLSVFLSFLPASLFAGTHVMQDDASLTIGSMTLTTGGQGIHFADGTTQTTAGGSGSGGSGYALQPTTVTIQANLGVTASTATLGNATDTTLGSNPWVIINSSGTSQALTVTDNGYPSGGVQNELGVVNIKRPLGDSPGASLVIVDSVTDSQLGAGVVELWSDNPLHNDPLIWIHRTSSNSSPEMRWDSPSPNMEIVNISTDNALGYGKWEPFAIASHGVDLQVNNRAYSNGTFETLAFWHPLSKLDIMPGLYLNAQNTTDDGGALVSSDTTGMFFQTLNSHTVGITAPQNSQFSWIMGLPILPKANGVLLYNAGNRGGNFSVRQSTWTDTDFTYATTTGVKISTLTITGQSTISNLTVVSSASLLSNVTLGSAGNSVTVSSNSVMPGATFYQNGTESLGTITAGVWNGTAISANSFLSGTLQASQEPAHTGDVTNTAGSLAMTAAGTQANITNFSGSITHTSSVTVNSTLQVSTLTTVGGIYNQGYNTASSNYVITSTDSYILCNCANNAVTLTLPLSSTANGQFLSITKADQSASSCTIRGAGSDQIVSTGTWFLYAQAQQLVIQSTGGVNLWQRAGAMDAPVEMLGNNIIVNAAETVAASSSVYCTWQTVASPQRAIGMYSSQSTANGNIDLAIIDTQGNKLAETGVIAMAGTSTITNFTSAVNLLPGVYGFCSQISNVTGAIRGAGVTVNKSFFNTETTMGIPATLTLPGTTTSLTFGIAPGVTGAP